MMVGRMSARGFLDKTEISFPCPECGRTLRQTIGAGRRGRSIRCSGGHTVQVDGRELDRETRKVEQQIDRLGRA